MKVLSGNMIENLGLDNCLSFKIGDTTVMLDEFKGFYNGGFGATGIILENKNRYFFLGDWYNRENNKIVKDLEEQEIEVQLLFDYIHNLIYEKIVMGLLYYVGKNKDKQLFSKDYVYFWRDYSLLGKNPINRIKEKIDFNIELDLLKDNEIILGTFYGNDNKSSILKFNITTNKFYVDNDDCISEEKEIELVTNYFCSTDDKNKYVLYYNYINNNLKNEDLAYKEIADLNKWLEEKNAVMVNVIYDKDGEEKNAKVKADTNNMFSDLSREYYKEMFSFWGCDDIKSITQIKGFKYKNDFHSFNSNNLLYKGE